MFLTNQEIEKIKKRIVYFIKESINKIHFAKVILGLSGGIDSAVTAALAVEALGKNHVIGVMMPYKTSSSSSKEDAELLAEQLGIKTYFKEITGPADAYFKQCTDMTSLRMGNVMARLRMIVLFDLSAKENAIVIGTGNRSEILLGYSTWFGDSACSLDPIADLYKTEVFELARSLNIPEKIINKPPSADLWTDQTDEKELGISYAKADLILESIFDKGWTYEKCLNSGLKAEEIQIVIRKLKNTQFKRVPPVFPDIRPHSSINALRIPHDWDK